MDRQEQIERIKEIGQLWSTPSKVSKEDKEILRSIYRIDTGLMLTNCSVCFLTAYLYYVTPKKQNMNNKFQLKPNKVLWNADAHQHITEVNMTDEIAIAMLKKSKGAIVFFKQFPENWKDIVDGKATFDSPYTPIKEKAIIIGANGQAKELEIEKPKTEEPVIKEEEESEEEEEDLSAEQIAENEKQIKKLTLEEKSKADLQAIATSNEYPMEEWQTLNKKQLIEYLLIK